MDTIYTDDMADVIEFYDVKKKKKVVVPKEQCRIETMETSRGRRKRIIATIYDTSQPRNLSRICSWDFKL